MSEQAANFVGSIPENYDRFLGPRIFHEFADDLAQRAARKNASHVLELAAGTGIVTRKLRDLLPGDSRITATDLNPPMLDVAKTKFQENEGVLFDCADATQLPYSDAKFDAVVCQFGVMFFPDKTESYREVFRALVPGGHYIFNVWGPLERNPFAKIANDTVTDFFPDDPPIFYQVPFGYSNKAAIVESLNEAGFVETSVETLEIRSEIPSSADFATGLVFGNPLFDEISSRGGDPDGVCSAIAEALDSNLGSEMPLQALVIVAKKPESE